MQGIDYPVRLSQIRIFERQNKISVNVYGIEETKKRDEKKKKCDIVPIHLTDDKRERHVNLLHIQDPPDHFKGHYAMIKNLSRLVGSQINKHNGRKYICDR